MPAARALMPTLVSLVGAACLLLPAAAAAQITSAEDLGVILGQGAGLTPPQAASTPPGTSDTITSFDANPGPWGSLHCFYVYLEAPKSLVEGFALPSSIPRWTFPESSVAALPTFFAKAGLSKALIDNLLSPKSMVKENGRVHLFPPLAELEEMSPQTRAIIYTELSGYPENEYHVDPVLIIGTTVEEWYRTSKLRPEIIAKIKKLSYLRGETIAFSDVAVLLNYAQSDSEARIIFKACTRTRNLMVRLKLDKNSNAEEIIKYWSFGVGIRRKDLEPLVTSIIETDGIEDLGVAHLLPALARKLLYTYPGMDIAKHGVLPDCHWTSLNFYNFEPHEYLLDARLATSQVLEQFVPVEPPYQYADILFFLDNTTGDAFHSCVHLADNIVYTKNGRNILSPWVIMRLEDVKKIYLYKGNGRVQGFRRKDIAAEKLAQAEQVGK
ncbi:MAG TPA: hypothetical protein VGE39_10265 [Prosthecobacter sp.]